MTMTESPTSLTETAERLGATFAATAAANDDADRFPAENFDALREAGVLAAGVPAELGGGGASFAELSEMLRTLAHHDPSTALALSMHTHQVVIPAWRWRNQNAPTDKLLRRVAEEQIVLISSGGSDWLDSSGTATKVEGGYEIRARKAFASGVPTGSLLMTSAVFEDPANGPTVLHFPISLKDEKVTIVESWRAMGMRSTGSHDIVIDGAFVPDAAIGGTRPKGVWAPLYHIVSLLALPLIYSVYVGVAEAARDCAVALAARKKDDADVQAAVGEMETQLRAAQIALAHAVQLASTAQPGIETTNEALILRTLIGDAAIRCVEKAMEAAGGSGFYRSAGLEKLFRDVQGARFHPLNAKAQARFSGRAALGVDVNH